VPAQDTVSVLFGMGGLQVTEAGHGAGGTLEVWAVTRSSSGRACPDCATPARRVHEYVLARPRDVRRGPDRVDLCWVKRRWKCDERSYARKTFTEWMQQVPARCRITGRLREQVGAEVAGRGITPAEAVRHAGVSWPVAHEAFAAAADLVLERPPDPVPAWASMSTAAAGPAGAPIRRPGSTSCWSTGGTLLLRPVRDQGLLGQVQGRTADDAAYWLAQAAPAWRHAIQAVAIDMCGIYASAVRRILPQAQIAVDLFRVAHLAVKMTGDVRLPVVRGRYGRRGRYGAPNTASRICWPGTWSTCPRPSSPRWSAPWTATRPGRRSSPPGSGRKTPAHAEPGCSHHPVHPVRA
jgi:transposase